MLFLQDFGISFAEQKLWEGINLKIPEGSIFHLKGPNASGKSSLLNAISGIIPEYVKAKTTGNILLWDIDLQTIPLKEKYHYLWHQLSDAEAQLFFPDCLSELAFALEHLALPPENIIAKINLAAAQFGLENMLQRDPSTLSGGEKKLLLCSVAETIDPPLLLLDEPLNGLDKQATDLVFKWLKNKKEQGKIIVVADHNPLMETVADFSYTLPENPQPLTIDNSLFTEAVLNLQDKRDCAIKLIPEVLYNIEELSFAYPNAEFLFKDLSIKINSTENILLKGKNGAGKSTFLKLLTGLLKPNKGKIYLQGKQLLGLDPKNFAHFYYQSQITKENLLGISVKQNWLFWQLAIPELKDLPIKEDPLFTELSAGQQKMVSQQILPYMLSKFWILDEPFASLDENAGKQLFNLLQYKSRNYPGMLIVSHSLEAHRELFDRVFSFQNQTLQEEKG
jgi:energy-coupling factor transport system ATP-binding protein